MDEIKTKLILNIANELHSLGIQPDMIILRIEVNINNFYIEKITVFCNINKEVVVQTIDVNILYDVIINLYKQRVDNYIYEH